MFTNTYSPHVGGVAKSVSGLAEGLRHHGHRVLVVAPEFPGMLDEDDVIRMPAIQEFAGTDFSAPFPVSLSLDERLDAFAPDIVHSHHPILLGGTALRVAAARNLPVIYTYHTRYELYDHYVLQDSQIMKRLAISLTIGYSNLCDVVIAPSQSIATFLHNNKIEVPVEIIPTGVKQSDFGEGNGLNARRKLNIPDSAFLVGHVGRLAPEKNLAHLTKALIIFLRNNPDAHFLVAGDGTMEKKMREMFASADLSQRLHMAGVVHGETLADTYASMDVFAFSSHSETQGLVLAEAMTARVPVVALDASGVREIVEDGYNGRLLASDASPEIFAAALSSIAKLNQAEMQTLRDAAKRTSTRYSHQRSVQHTIEFYSSVLATKTSNPDVGNSPWESAMRSLGKEWDIIGNVAHAVSDAVFAPDVGEQ